VATDGPWKITEVLPKILDSKQGLKREIMTYQLAIMNFANGQIST
jgi:hypothetical protein